MTERGGTSLSQSQPGTRGKSDAGTETALEPLRTQRQQCLEYLQAEPSSTHGSVKEPLFRLGFL